MRLRFTGLWRHLDFLRLWAGQTVSLFGSEVRFLALSLTAVVVLNATPAQMGILMAVGGLPPLLIGFFVGAWVDRRKRRPVMIAADWGRAALILIIPVFALLGVLRIEMLYFVAFGMGTLAMFFDVAYRSILPSLIDRKQLIEGNSKLEVSASAAEIAGPGIGGALVQLVTAPIALVVDSVTFMVSALFLQFIRATEPEPVPVDQRESIWKEAGEGFRVVWTNPILRGLAGCAGTIGFFNAMLDTIFILYMTNRLGLSAGLIGLIFSIGGVGFLLGALMGERTTRMLGLGPSIIAGVILVALSDLALPTVGGPTIMVVIVLSLAGLFFGFGLTTYNIGQVSLRQAVTPDHLQGRMNAIMRVLMVGTIPIGALVGGALGEIIDLRLTLFVGITGEMLAVAWLLLSPVRSLREHPESV